MVEYNQCLQEGNFSDGYIRTGLYKLWNNDGCYPMLSKPLQANFSVTEAPGMTFSRKASVTLTCLEGYWRPDVKQFDKELECSSNGLWNWAEGRLTPNTSHPINCQLIECDPAPDPPKMARRHDIVHSSFFPSSDLAVGTSALYQCPNQLNESLHPALYANFTFGHGEDIMEPYVHEFKITCNKIA